MVCCTAKCCSTSGTDLSEIKSSGKDCYVLAKETSELCAQTISKTGDMVTFGEEIKSTLEDLSQGVDASKLSTIRDLIDGDIVKSSISLGKDVNSLAIECANKAIAMIARMEDGVKALPDFVEDMIDDHIMKGEHEDDPEPADVSRDIEELQTCQKAIEELNLFTAMEAGLNAFRGLASKADVCKTLFTTIKGFADAVMSITEAFIEHQWTEAVSKIKDIFRCIRLSNLIKQYAGEVEKLIRYIIDLFKNSSRSLGSLWGALDHAKEYLSKCLSYAWDTKRLCSDALSKSNNLVEKSRDINDQMKFRSSSTSSLKSLLVGDDIRSTIDIANNMDGIIKECNEKVVTMVDLVKDGYNSLPEIITDGIDDFDEAGKADDDPQSADVEREIEEIDRARNAVENADVFTFVKASSDGFLGVTEKSKLCQEMLTQSEGFADKSIGTIESFMGTWDLNVAMDKIIEMCRLARLGEMIKQFAEQIVKLLASIVALIKSITNKVKDISVEDITESITTSINHATSSFNRANDFVGSLKMKFCAVEPEFLSMKFQ